MKKVRTYMGYSIYERSEKELAADSALSRYELYAKDESPLEYFAPEWEADTVEELINFVKASA